MKAGSVFSKIKKSPKYFYIIHYSSESLFGEEKNVKSPRITSVAVMQFETRQTKSFSLHAVAEELGFTPDQVEENYDAIERELLTQFFNFARDRRSHYWLHWNMRNQVFGFEHLEHRYRVTAQEEPPEIPVEQRINISDVLNEYYGDQYADDPKMLSLMKLNGDQPQGLLTGGEEAECFKNKDFIRMHASTLAKVNFFYSVIRKALQGKLKTKGRSLGARADTLLESRSARMFTLVSAIIGIPSAIAWIISALR